MRLKFSSSKGKRKLYTFLGFKASIKQMCTKESVKSRLSLVYGEYTSDINKLRKVACLIHAT